MAYLLAGPVVCLLGIVAIFFVLRRKSVEKRSMYSARRQQIEHKVRAARQRTLAPKAHEAKPAAQPNTVASPFDQPQGQAFEYFTPSTHPGAGPQPPSYQPSAFEPAAAAPPVAPPTPPPAAPPPAEPQWEPPAVPQTPWEVGPTPSGPTPEPAFGYPAAPPEEFKPAPEPTPRVQPSEPAWTPAPQPSPPATKIEQPAAAASTTAAGGWSVVPTTKGEAGEAKGKERVTSASWALASGQVPGMESEEEADVKRPSGTAVAVAQYAVLVVGLVMVLIGVLVMVANSHVS